MEMVRIIYLLRIGAKNFREKDKETINRRWNKMGTEIEESWKEKIKQKIGEGTKEKEKELKKNYVTCNIAQSDMDCTFYYTTGKKKQQQNPPYSRFIIHRLQ